MSCRAVLSYARPRERRYGKHQLYSKQHFKRNDEFNLSCFVNTWLEETWSSLTGRDLWRFSCRQERGRMVLFPESFLTSNKTCSLSLWGDAFLCSAACSHETFKNLNAWYLDSSLECSWNWPMGSKGISEVRQTYIHMCACIHICTALPSRPHPPKCLHKSDFPWKPGWRKRSRGKSNKILFYSVMMRLLQRPLVQLCGVLYTVPLTVRQEDNYCAREGTMI